MEKIFLETSHGIRVNMHQHSQQIVKTIELEDQYAVIRGFELWPEEPREIDFFRKSWFSQNMFVRKCQKNIKIELKWVQD